MDENENESEWHRQRYDDGIISTTSGNRPKHMGSPAPDPELKPGTGQHKDYWVLSDSELSKGFIRPVRDSYVHVGISGPKNPLCDLTEEQSAWHSAEGYVKFEKYPESESPALGKYWTQLDLDKIEGGCGSTTTMGRRLAETYAREPGFYGSTYCCCCGAHFPVGKDGEFVWTGTNERVGT